VLAHHVLASIATTAAAARIRCAASSSHQREPAASRAGQSLRTARQARALQDPAGSTRWPQPDRPLACCLRNVKRLKAAKDAVASSLGRGRLMTASCSRAAARACWGSTRRIAAGLSPFARLHQGEAFEQAIRSATQGRASTRWSSRGPRRWSPRGRLAARRRDLNIFASFHPSETKVDLNGLSCELTIMSSYSPAPRTCARPRAHRVGRFSSTIEAKSLS